MIDLNIENIGAPEIAKHLNSTLATIHRYRKNGTLPKPKYKLNTVYLWDRIEIDVWLDELKKSKMSVNDISEYIGKSKEVVITYRNIGLIPKPKKKGGGLSWNSIDVVKHCEKLIGLVTVKEISKETGYSESTILNRSKSPDFPQPELIIKGCRLWRLLDVKKYMDKK